MKQILIFALFFILSFTGFAQIKVGSKAPELQVKELYNNYNELKHPLLANLEGKVVVLDFWSTWCKPCVNAFPKLNELHDIYKNQAQFIAISDDPKEKLETFLNKVSIDIIVACDENKNDFKNYQVASRPQIFIINKKGYIVYTGGVINETILNEVIATDTFISKPQISFLDIISDAGFAGGEDPLFNAMAMMRSNNKPKQYLINYFIIRPSFDTEKSYGFKNYQNGYIGITYTGGRLEDIFSYFYKLQSPVWVKNNTKHSLNYDIVYYRKIKNRDAANEEILKHLFEDLSIRFDTLTKEQIVYLVSLKQGNENIKTSDELNAAIINAYTSIEEYIKAFEEKAEVLCLIDSSLQNRLIFNQEMDWNKLYDASSDDVKKFLEKMGLIFEQRNKRITYYQINNK